MGDYRKHQSETGRYLCNSFEDVQAIGVSPSNLLTISLESTKRHQRRRNTQTRNDVAKIRALFHKIWGTQQSNWIRSEEAKRN